MNISLETRIFKAAVPCMAKKDVRYYLNGACLRLTDGVKGQIYATDGHKLFAGNFDINGHEDISDCTGTIDLIIPYDVVVHASKIKTPKMILESINDSGYILGGLQFQPVQGKFPDVARVIPGKEAFTPETMAPGHYQPDYLLAVNKSLKAWFENRVKDATYNLFQRGPDHSAIMQGPDNSAIGVIMPIRVEVPDVPYDFHVTPES